MASQKDINSALARIAAGAAIKPKPAPQTKSRRAGYREAVEWIAFNEDTDIGSSDTGYLVTICMIADLFGKEQEVVARAVMTKRSREGL